MLTLTRDISIRAALIGAALFFIRYITPEFARGTTTAEQPYVLFVVLLMLAGGVWFSFIPLLKRLPPAPSRGQLTLLIFALGLGFRALFFGSTPVYEDDWNRYLWDGYVITQAVNPYLYSPDDIRLAPPDAPEDLRRLSQLSEDNNHFTARINSPQYTTIYPPVAAAIFALAAVVSPLNLDVLRIVFWLSEALTLFLLVRALQAFGRSALWMALYAFNPLIIYAGMNAAHMDVLLVPALLGALIAVKTRPYLAAVCLSLAAAIKIWPVLLAPVLYRHWLARPKVYLASAAIITGLSALLLLPMLLTLGGASGTSAYAATWQRSTFLFPLIDQAIGTVSGHWSTPARIFIAAVCAGLSLWLGFIPALSKWPASTLRASLPAHLLLVTFVFFLLSPTGFPWYLIWLFAFFPLAPFYSVGTMTVLLPLYYLRYALGENGSYILYTDWLVPLQFSIPAGLLLLELSRGQWHGKRFAAPAQRGALNAR